jgi:predicted metal-dependent hydrolase
MSSGLLRRLGEQLGLFDDAPAGGAEAGAARHQVWLGGQRLPYELTRARRRSIGFAVGPEGLRVRAPRWVSVADIEAALGARADWILRQLQVQQQRRHQQELLRIQWGEGAELPYLGRMLRLVRGVDAQQALEREALLHLPLPEAATEAQWRDLTQAWLQAQAREHFAQRLAHFAAKLGVAPPRLRLSSAQGRGGSASSSGVVSLNWRLMHFSPVLIDYVVAHEVAHLREMNHGPDFWALVGTLQPGYETAREALKRAQLPGF